MEDNPVMSRSINIYQFVCTSKYVVSVVQTRYITSKLPKIARIL